MASSELVKNLRTR